MIKMMRRTGVFWLVPLLLIVACSAAPTARQVTPAQNRESGGQTQTRGLVIADRAQPEVLADRIPARVPGGGSADLPRLFNAGLVIDDDRGESRAYLAEAV